MVDVETYVSSVSSINEKEMVGVVRSAHIRQKCTFLFENSMDLRHLFMLTWSLMACVLSSKLNFDA